LLIEIEAMAIFESDPDAAKKKDAQKAAA
jgi:hypothetical protein